VSPVPVARGFIERLERGALLFYTNQKRDANVILGKQSQGTADRMGVLKAMRDLAGAMREAVAGEGDLQRFAALLHEGWELKRSLGFGISDGWIDGWYESARKAGALGGKLLGAGGGGFMLFVAPESRHEAIREALGRPQELPFRVDRLGSRIIFINE